MTHSLPAPKATAAKQQASQAHMESVANVTPAMRSELKDLVRLLKRNIVPDVDVTDREMDVFLSKIFRDSWTTAKRTNQPERNQAQASFKDTAVWIGTLVQDLPKSATTKAGRGITTGRAHAYATEPPDSQTKKSRKQGAPVFIRASTNEGLQLINFQLVDERGSLVSLKPETYVTKMSMEEMYLSAMEQHDEYHLTTLQTYNERVAIYLARKRLQYWNAGHAIDTLPEEMPNQIVTFTLCRNAYLDLPNALAQLRDRPAPKFYTQDDN